MPRLAVALAALALAASVAAQTNTLTLTTTTPVSGITSLGVQSVVATGLAASTSFWYSVSFGEGSASSLVAATTNGSGTFSPSVSATYTYRAAGQKTVTLSIFSSSTSATAVRTLTATVQVTGAALLGSGTAPVAGVNNTGFNFTTANITSLTASSTYFYELDLDVGGTVTRQSVGSATDESGSLAAIADLVGQSPIWPQAGSRSVSLRIFNNATDNTTVSVSRLSLSVAGASFGTTLFNLTNGTAVSGIRSVNTTFGSITGLKPNSTYFYDLDLSEPGNVVPRGANVSTDGSGNANIPALTNSTLPPFFNAGSKAVRLRIYEDATTTTPVSVATAPPITVQGASLQLTPGPAFVGEPSTAVTQASVVGPVGLDLGSPFWYTLDRGDGRGPGPITLANATVLNDTAPVPELSAQPPIIFGTNGTATLEWTIFASNTSTTPLSVAKAIVPVNPAVPYNATITLSPATPIVNQTATLTISVARAAPSPYTFNLSASIYSGEGAAPPNGTDLVYAALPGKAGSVLANGSSAAVFTAPITYSSTGTKTVRVQVFALGGTVGLLGVDLPLAVNFTVAGVSTIAARALAAGPVTCTARASTAGVVTSTAVTSSNGSFSLTNNNDYVAMVTSCRDTLTNYSIPDSTISSFVYADLATSGLVASPLSSVAAAQADPTVRFNLTAFAAKLQKFAVKLGLPASAGNDLASYDYYLNSQVTPTVKGVAVNFMQYSVIGTVAAGTAYYAAKCPRLSATAFANFTSSAAALYAERSLARFLDSSSPFNVSSISDMSGVYNTTFSLIAAAYNVTVTYGTSRRSLLQTTINYNSAIQAEVAVLAQSIAETNAIVSAQLATVANAISSGSTLSVAQLQALVLTAAQAVQTQTAVLTTAASQLGAGTLTAASFQSQFTGAALQTLVKSQVISTPGAPPSSPPSSPPPSSDKKKGLSGGAIAGIVIGAVVGGLLIIGLIVFIIVRRQRSHVGPKSTPAEAVQA